LLDLGVGGKKFLSHRRGPPHPQHDIFYFYSVTPLEESGAMPEDLLLASMMQSNGNRYCVLVRGGIRLQQTLQPSESSSIKQNLKLHAEIQVATS
jgi:hypothetical protein